MTSLYRHFDRDGRLLYVGVSKNAIARLRGHQRVASWYRDICNVSIDHYPDREAAMRAEAIAIRDERPAYNISRPAPKPARDKLSVILDRCVKEQKARKPVKRPEGFRAIGYIRAALDEVEPIISRMMERGVGRELLFLDMGQNQDSPPPGLLGMVSAAQHPGVKVLISPSIPDYYRDILKDRGVIVRAVA